MNYKETINYLFNSTPVFEHVGASAYKENLFNTITLDKHFCHPHRLFKSIHIAGTNGKGSCAHALASILQEDGYKVGLYTSPHLIDFKERIRVNGAPIDERYVIDFVENERSFFEPLHPSFFELTTALAFKYFAHQQVDIAVIEVGLGGRLDCTNIISPLLSVITNISFDHTALLGTSLATIAAEKAGIIKPHTSVIIGKTCAETKPVFINVANQNQAPITFAEDISEVICAESTQEGGLLLQTKTYNDISYQLGGLYQKQNANTILAAAGLLLSMNIIHTPQSIKRGMEKVCQNTGLKGRWQYLHHQPNVVCDTGHNFAGWQYINQQLQAQTYKTLRIVFGMVNDKDIKSVLKLLPQTAKYYFTNASTQRSIPAKDIQLLAAKEGLNGQVFADVKSAYDTALAEADKEDFVFIGGSSYVVADLLSALAH
jgi:bifunctional protein folC